MTDAISQCHQWRTARPTGTAGRTSEQVEAMNSTQFVDAPDASFDHAPELTAGDQLLTVQDAARFLKVSVSWVYEHVRPEADDRLPVVKLGKYLRFDRRDLQAYIDAKRAESRRQPRRR